MSTTPGPESTVTPAPGAAAAPHPRPDAGHLDLDAECLEDPVHCGDARHQHDAHAAGTGPAAGAETQPA